MFSCNRNSVLPSTSISFACATSSSVSPTDASTVFNVPSRKVKLIVHLLKRSKQKLDIKKVFTLHLSRPLLCGFCPFSSCCVIDLRGSRNSGWRRLCNSPRGIAFGITYMPRFYYGASTSEEEKKHATREKWPNVVNISITLSTLCVRRKHDVLGS